MHGDRRRHARAPNSQSAPLGQKTNKDARTNAKELGRVATKVPTYMFFSFNTIAFTFVPRELWKNVNLILVGFGQQICVPVSPRCHGCSNSSMCPSSSTKNK